MRSHLPKGILIFLLVSLTVLTIALADRNHLGFGFDSEKETVTIPFKNINNLIVLEATLDGQNQLNLILDTGIRSFVLFNKSYVPEISDHTFPIKFSAAGVHTPISAKVSTNHTLRLSEDIVANKINAVILKRSNYHLHKIKGLKIHGVFGYQFFTRFRVKIDYKQQTITLTNPTKNVNIEGFETIPMQIHDTKPFVSLDALSSKNEWHQLSMVLDLGANHKMLIHTLPKNFDLDKKYLEHQHLAEGLNGSILGHKTTLTNIKMGATSYEFIEVLIPTDNTYKREHMQIQKHGSIGGKFFNDKSIIVDYANGLLFIENSDPADKTPVPYLTQKQILNGDSQ